MALRLRLDAFCFKQFDPASGSVQVPYDKEEFTKRVQDMCNWEMLKPGYAPFCKHIFIENFTEAKQSYLAITEENKALLRSGYEARRAEEFAVLGRWFNAGEIGDIPKAGYLDLILYSKEQIDSENAAMNAPPVNEEYDYGIISIKPQDVDYELPMQPITMMRNAMGEEYGGSGVKLDFETYAKSVEFWQANAILR